MFNAFWRNPQSFVGVALNKADLVDEQTLANLMQAAAFKDQSQMLALHSTLAKTGKAVDDILQTLTQRMTKSE